VLRRLADGVAEAHRVGLAVGGLTPENVVLRPNGLVGLRGVPAATGSIDGDVAALGALLDACLTGLRPGEPEPRPLQGPSDLVALARRARSTQPGQALSSVAAMAAILAERPRSRPSTGSSRADRNESQRSDRHRSEAPVPLDPDTLPPVPPARPAGPGTTVSPVALGGDTVHAMTVVPTSGAYAGTPQESSEDDYEQLSDDLYAGQATGSTALDDEDGARRHKLLVIGLPLLALLVVIALAWWVGTSLLSVAGSVDEDAPPAISVPTAGPQEGAGDEGGGPAAGPEVAITGASVFDPGGDGAPENDGDVPLTFDGDPATAWSTLTYRGSPAFGNLKPGVGVLYDLGSTQDLGGVTVTTPTPGATVEVRTADTPPGALEGSDVAASATLEDSTELTFDEPVQARYVLLWITGLVDGPDGFSAAVSEVTVQTAG
jgi:hypothetical protein